MRTIAMNKGQITANYTRYDTAALQALLDLVVGTKLVSNPGGTAKLDISDTIRVETLYVEKKPKPTKGKREKEKDELVVLGDIVLKIAPPDEVWVAYPLHGLGSTVGETPCLPDVMVERIATAVLRSGLSEWVFRQVEKEPGFRGLMQRVARDIQIPIHPRNVDKKPPPITRTADEKLQLLIDAYSTGGQLPITKKRTRDGWSPEYIEWCRTAYDKELAKRQVKRSKILAKGGFVSPYETFPELLRRVAKDIDNIGEDKEVEL